MDTKIHIFLRFVYYEKIQPVPSFSRFYNGINDRPFRITEKINAFVQHNIEPVKHTIMIGLGIYISVFREGWIGYGKYTFKIFSAVEGTLNTDLPGITVPIIISDSVVIGPVNGNNRPKAELYVPSKRIFTFKDGYVRIILPEEVEKKYNIKFFSDDELLFELKDVKERNFKIDKANFYHAGWFRFELYENGELLEKNKFYIPKEF